MEYDIIGNVLKITIDAMCYSEAVLFKCFYWYGNTFQVDIRKSGETTFEVTLKCIETADVQDWEAITTRIKRDLVDFRLRQIVTEETRIVRELIIAKAFAYYEEEMPVSGITDPVGFDPQHV